MIDGHLLEATVALLVPNFDSIADWGDTWDRPIENGAAFEWTTVAALIAIAAERGYTYSLPPFEFEAGQSLFRTWNVIPHHYGAQAGHAVSVGHEQDLASRFIQALVPKVVLQKGQSRYSIFREGCPQQALATGLRYDERPDILILPGAPVPGYPRLTKRGTGVEYAFQLDSGLVISGTLRVLNAPLPRLLRRSPEEPTPVPVTGIIECSVNKSAAWATAQCAKYMELFSAPDYVVPVMLLLGNALSAITVPARQIDLQSRDKESLALSFRRGASEALDLMAII